MWTKKQVINKAMASLGIASYELDISPEEYQSVLMSMDAMFATWNRKGIRFGYALPSSPLNSELNDSSYLPDDIVEAATYNLAIAIAPEFGIEPNMIVFTKAKQTFDSLMVRAAQPIEMRFPTTMPRGSGNKRIDNNFYNEDTDPDIINGPEDIPTFLP